MNTMASSTPGLKDIPQQIADNAFDAVNELLSIERLSIAVYNEAAHRLEYASNPLEGVAENKLVWEDLMQCCFEEQRYLSENGMQALPLIVKAGNSTQCIGVLCLVRSRMQQESDRLLLELIARYIAIVIFNAVVKLAMKYRDIETAQDEARRASWEDSLRNRRSGGFHHSDFDLRSYDVLYLRWCRHQTPAPQDAQAIGCLLRGTG